jgi:hypothetical protein
MRFFILFVSLFFCLCARNATAQDTSALAQQFADTLLAADSVLVEEGLVLTADSVVRAMPDSSLAQQKDSVLQKKKFQPDAKRAGLYSALIPGLGQLYNRQYWKVPIVYAALGTTLYFVIKGNSDYQRYRKAYISRLSNGQNSKDEFMGILETPAIKTYQDEAKQNMDMMTVLTVIAYAGQILEAISGAHLKNFDISKDLTMQVRPVLTPLNTIGFGLVVNFKK